MKVAIEMQDKQDSAHNLHPRTRTAQPAYKPTVKKRAEMQDKQNNTPHNLHPRTRIAQPAYKPIVKMRTGKISTGKMRTGKIYIWVMSK